jgi:phenylacetic acid degradation protein PaaD
MSDPADPVVPAVRAMLAADGAARTWGIVVESAADGRARARLTVEERMLNGNRSLHGGVLFTLADVAFAAASNSLGPTTVAASASIDFLRPTGPGDVLIAEAVLRTEIGRQSLFDVTVRREREDARSEVVAEVRGRAMALRPT